MRTDSPCGDPFLKLAPQGIHGRNTPDQSTVFTEEARSSPEEIGASADRLNGFLLIGSSHRAFLLKKTED